MATPTARKLLLKQTKKSDPRSSDKEVDFALNYLESFGFFGRLLNGWKEIKLGDIAEALSLFQAWWGLKRTGKLCAYTLKSMEMPRCGCPDIIRDYHEAYAEVQRFIKRNLMAWRKRGLKYAVQSYVPRLSKSSQDDMLERAWQSWTRHGGLVAERVSSGHVDVVISTGQGRRSNFDGPGGTLAWAELPPGDDRQLLLKMDVDENWGDDPRQPGIYYLGVMAHELGHIGGLTHSKKKTALMWASYRASIWEPQADDDIPRWAARYPRQPGIPAPVPPTATRRLITLEVDGDVRGARVTQIA